MRKNQNLWNIVQSMTRENFITICTQKNRKIENQLSEHLCQKKRTAN